MVVVVVVAAAAVLSGGGGGSTGEFLRTQTSSRGWLGPQYGLPIRQNYQV